MRCRVAGVLVRQSVVAGASGIAEWYGVATVSAEALYLRDLLERFGWDMRLEIRVDSSAALDIGRRLGAGRLRTLECQTLWVQQKVKDGQVTLAKEPGDRNPADVGTKAYGVKALENVAALFSSD